MYTFIWFIYFAKGLKSIWFQVVMNWCGQRIERIWSIDVIGSLMDIVTFYGYLYIDYYMGNYWRYSFQIDVSAQLPALPVAGAALPGVSLYSISSACGEKVAVDTCLFIHSNSWQIFHRSTSPTWNGAWGRCSCTWRFRVFPSANQVPPHGCDASWSSAVVPSWWCGQ